MLKLAHYRALRKLDCWILATTLVTLPALTFTAQSDSGKHQTFGARIAGTYLHVSEHQAQILQIGADGSVNWELSEEFEGSSVEGANFSDSLGNWQRTGSREIGVITLNLNYLSETKTFVGTGVTRSTIEFDKNMHTATAHCEGATYAPGVDPLADGASPIPGSEYSCWPTQFQKLSGIGD